MNTVELLQFSFKNACDILGGVTADLTQEQADWEPPGTANPAGATYWHVVAGVDQALCGWGMGQPPLGETAGWNEKVLLTAPPDWGEPPWTLWRPSLPDSMHSSRGGPLFSGRTPT